jgi:hypothetical protein
MPVTRVRFAGLDLECDSGDLPFDPFAPVLPLELVPGRVDGRPEAAQRPADVALQAALVSRPQPSPEAGGAVPVLFHGTTRCFKTGDGTLALWDGASVLHVAPDGRHIHALVHGSSLERAFLFSSVTVLVALFLALRGHRLFHLHAAAATWPGGETWLIPGDAGAGKSTLALALFSAGARFLSDDALVVHGASAAAEVTAWTRMIRMTAQTAAAFPRLAPLLVPCPPPSAREWQLDPRAAFPGRGQAFACEPFTLLFPRIASAAESSAAALDRADAFGRLLQSCAWVASEHVPRRQEQLDALARVVDSARAFEVAVGRRILHDPAAVAAEIQALLR